MARLPRRVLPRRVGRRSSTPTSSSPPRTPGRVHALVGNHEHGHIGGPHTAKFAADEVVLLENLLGPAGTARLHEILASLPLAAIAPCGAVFTHGAPAAEIQSIAEVEDADLSGFELESPLEILDTPVLGPILWARSAQPDVAARFVRAMGGTISIYGHDVIPEGFERIGDEQLVVSTSFGVFDSNKVYLDLDLGAHYQTVHDLRDRQGDRALVPGQGPCPPGRPGGLNTCAPRPAAGPGPPCQGRSGVLGCPTPRA